MKDMISKILVTENLIISNATLEECTELQAICDTWEEKESVEGEKFASDYILKCLTEGDLPPIPNADISNYNLKTISLKESRKIIGFIDVYHGFPKVDTIWISIFVLHKDFRKKGIGQEVIDCLSKDAAKTNYNKMGLGVQLKNWPALRFWSKAGFDKILGIYGDETYSHNNFALIGLEKNLG